MDALLLETANYIQAEELRLAERVELDLGTARGQNRIMTRAAAAMDRLDPDSEEYVRQRNILEEAQIRKADLEAEAARIRATEKIMREGQRARARIEAREQEAYGIDDEPSVAQSVFDDMYEEDFDEEAARQEYERRVAAELDAEEERAAAAELEEEKLGEVPEVEQDPIIGDYAEAHAGGTAGGVGPDINAPVTGADLGALDEAGAVPTLTSGAPDLDVEDYVGPKQRPLLRIEEPTIREQGSIELSQMSAAERASFEANLNGAASAGMGEESLSFGSDGSLMIERSAFSKFVSRVNPEWLVEQAGIGA